MIQIYHVKNLPYHRVSYFETDLIFFYSFRILTAGYKQRIYNMFEEGTRVG